jgi:molecular chaperone Hsp33
MQYPAHGDDWIVPFQVDPLDVRGRTVRLGAALDTILARHAYPDTVARLLGEAITLTALLGNALKLDGRLQLQTRTDGPVGMLVVDFEAPDKVRAYAQFDRDMTLEGLSPGQLLGRGHLALTIDQGGDFNRYQGLVALEGQSLDEAAHQYFRQSEQIPTRVKLAVGRLQTGAGTAWRAGGLFVQFLPTAPERMRQPDFDPGDAPAGTVREAFIEDDAWVEARALVDTIEDHELLDPTMASEQLLFRLFNERGVRVFEGNGLRHACRCSQARIRAMLERFSPAERADMLTPEGRIGVTCEFCSTYYDVDPASLSE